MAQALMQTAMIDVLTKCGFSTVAHRNYMLNIQGLDSWDAYTMIDFADIVEISKQASRHNPRIPIGIIKLKNLKALKFWIEDKNRMAEIPVHTDFTPAVLLEYIQLYAVTSGATDHTEFSIGPKLDPTDWHSFSNGTEESLGTLKSKDGVPLSYIIRDDSLRPAIGPNSTRAEKIFWNARFVGPSYRKDQDRVWGYLAQRLVSTQGWNVVKTYQKSKNARQAWLDLVLFYAGPAERRKDMIVAHASLKNLTYKSEAIFPFASYASQMMGHLETLERGGQPESEEQKVTRLLDQIENSNTRLLTAVELVSSGVTFRDAITRLSSTIAAIYPLAPQKGRKSLISETETTHNLDYKNSINGVSFNAKNWNGHFETKDYKCFPLQLRKLIGLGKAEMKKNGGNELTFQNNDSKRKASQVAEDERVDSRVTMALQNKIVPAGESEETSMVSYDADQSQSETVGAGSAFGNKRQHGIARPKGPGER